MTQSTQTQQTKLPIAVLISGGGSTLKNLIAYQSRGELDVDFRLVVSSNPEAKGLTYASDAGIPSVVFEKKKGMTSADYRDLIFPAVRGSGAQLVVMGGFLKHVLIPEDFANRVVNIHPSLIPMFCGKGFYGHHVHEAVLAYGCKLSGCTVHFVDDHYDHGPILMQSSVPVLAGDTPDELAKRVFKAECETLPRAINAIAKGKVRMQGRIVEIAS